MVSLVSYLPFAGLGLLAALVSYFIGMAAGRCAAAPELQGRADRLESRVDRETQFRKGLQRTLDQIKNENQRYLNCFVNFPEGVKRLGASYDLDHVCSAVIRLTKDLIDAESIAIFLHHEKEEILKLEFAYGLRKEGMEGQGIVKLGEGKIGMVAQTGILMSEDDFIREEGLGNFVPGNGFFDRHPMSYCTPIKLGNRLLGALFIGRIKNPGDNEKRFTAMMADLAAMALQNAISMQSARSAANTDPLTELFNRGYFSQRLLEEKAKSLSYGKPFSLFLFDIDHFKNYNDTNGHPAGDVLLKQISTLVRDNVRKTDVVARYGGEEFIVLFSDVDGEQAYRLADQLRQRIEMTRFPHAEKQPLGRLTVSGGVASFPADGDDTHSIVKCADRALYQAKQEGRNRVVRGVRTDLIDFIKQGGGGPSPPPAVPGP